MIHLILTRFAIRTPFTPLAKGPHPALSEGWVAQRFEIFKRYCSGSLQSQTRPDFKHLVFVHPEFSPAWTARISALDERIEVIETDDCSNLPRYQVRGALVTTRLDSDDGLAVNAVEVIQSWAEHQTDSASMLSLCKGYKLEAASGNVYENGIGDLFLSLMERRSPKTGVLSFSHEQVHQLYDVQQNLDPLHWMTAHESNVCMGFVAAGSRLVDKSEVRRAFPCV